MNATLSSDILLGEQAVKAFTPEWDNLVTANPRATVFQTSSWYLAWLSAAAIHESVTPVVLRVPATGHMRAALALQVCSVEAKTLRPLSWPWADYHDGVGSPFDDEAIASLSQVLHDLLAEQHYLLLLDDVVPSGLWQRVLAHLPALESLSSHTSAIDLTHTAHLEQVLNKNEYIVKWRRLQRMGAVRCNHHLELSAVLKRFPTFVELHRHYWAGREDSVAPFDGIIDETFEAMIHHLAPRGLIMLTELLLGKQSIAMYLGFTYGGRYSGYRTAFDATYRRLSPGHLMLRQMILDFTSAGFRELDLMRGDYDYKREYTDCLRRNKRFELDHT